MACKLKQNAVNFKREGFLAKMSIYLINNIIIMHLILKENLTKITERLIPLVDHNRCRLVFVQFPMPRNSLQKE